MTPRPAQAGGAFFKFGLGATVSAKPKIGVSSAAAEKAAKFKRRAMRWSGFDVFVLMKDCPKALRIRLRRSSRNSRKTRLNLLMMIELAEPPSKP